ncbi:MAG: hypothetical protein ABSC72_02130 [Methylovirgula sp.]|jgi:Ni/Co efflux regulator RcnB
MTFTIAATRGTMEFTPMNRTRAFFTASIIAAAILAPGMASAQQSDSSKTVTKVETWTKKQWEAAKKDWAKDKIKWAACEKQSKEQKLEGRKSWSFLYTCMSS